MREWIWECSKVLRTDRIAAGNNSILGLKDFSCEQRNLEERDALVGFKDHLTAPKRYLLYTVFFLSSQAWHPACRKMPFLTESISLLRRGHCYSLGSFIQPKEMPSRVADPFLFVHFMKSCVKKKSSCTGSRRRGSL